MDELFSPSEVAMESPRLRWLRVHGVRTREVAKNPPAARFEARGPGGTTPGAGDSEEEAQKDWGVKNGVRLWNEELPAA